MQLANQKTYIPTNKLLVLHIVTLLMWQFGMDFASPWPEIVESHRFVISWVVGAVIAYFVPDFENEPRGGTHAPEV
jgi:hypothetical protein